MPGVFKVSADVAQRRPREGCDIRGGLRRDN